MYDLVWSRPMTKVAEEFGISDVALKKTCWAQKQVGKLWAVAVALAIGFLGNEAVAIFRIRVGCRIGSAALIADGHHARIDGWTSVAVLVGVLGVWLGYPLADPISGLIITAAIFGIVIQSGSSVSTVLRKSTNAAEISLMLCPDHAY